MTYEENKTNMEKVWNLVKISIDKTTTINQRNVKLGMQISCKKKGKLKESYSCSKAWAAVMRFRGSYLPINTQVMLLQNKKR